MSYATKSSLDLENARTGKKHGSLLAPWMKQDSYGMRLLPTWIDRPLVNQAAIMERRILSKFSWTISSSVVI